MQCSFPELDDPNVSTARSDHSFPPILSPQIGLLTYSTCKIKLDSTIPHRTMPFLFVLTFPIYPYRYFNSFISGNILWCSKPILPGVIQNCKEVLCLLFGTCFLGSSEICRRNKQKYKG